jgi:hypothetical protein
MKTIQGFAWLAVQVDLPDLDFPDHPIFDDTTTRQLDDPLPGDILFFDYVEDAAGISVHPSGVSYLFITLGNSPPPMRAGWTIVPAEIEQGYVRDDGAIRVSRIMGQTASTIGPVTQAVFEIKEGADE